MDEFGFTRRGLMQAGAFAAAGTMLAQPGLAQAADTTGAAMVAKGGYDPRTSSEGLIKLEAYKDGRPAPWWYVGTIYAVREREKPLALFKFEGCEVYRAQPQPGGDAYCDLRTLTFFRDLTTNAWIDEYANPFTGETNPIRPNVLSGKMYFPADGSPPRPRSAGGSSEMAPGGYDKIDPDKPTGSYEWIVAGDMILRKGDRSGPARIQPAMECQATFGDAAAFFDPEVEDMMARFSSATFSPYLAWMGMGDAPGHLLWHAAGSKLKGFEDLPAEYAARAQAIKPGLIDAPFD